MITNRSKKEYRILSRKARRLVREQGGTHTEWMHRLTSTTKTDDVVVEKFNPFKQASVTNKPKRTVQVNPEREARLEKLRAASLRTVEKAKQLALERERAIAESGLTPAEYDELQELEALTHEELQEDYE